MSSENIHIRELLKGFSISFVIKMIGFILGYVFTVILTRNFLAYGTGIYSLSLSLIITLSTFSGMGFQTSILRYSSQYSSVGHISVLSSIYSRMILFSLPVSLLVSLSFYVSSEFLSNRVFHDLSLIIPLKISSLTIPFMCILLINIETIRGFKNILFSEYIRNINTSLFTIIFLLLSFNYLKQYYSPLLCYAAALLISFTLSSIYILRKLSFSEKTVEDNVKSKDIFNISLPMAVTTFSFLLMGNTDKIMLGIFSSANNVGLYAIAFKLAYLTRFVHLSINSIAAPKFSELYWSKNYADLEKTVNYTSKIIFHFSIPIVVPMIIFPDFFLSIFGPEFLAAKYPLLILLAGQAINSSCGSVGFYLNMTGRQIVLRNIVLFSLLLNILLNILLIPKYGSTGAAISTSISISTWNILSVYYVYSKDKLKTFFTPFEYKIFSG